MTQVRRDEVMIAATMIERGASTRAVARQVGVSEGTLRDRLRRAAEDAPDGRRNRPAAVAGFADAVRAVLAVWQETAADLPEPAGRPISRRLVFEALVRDYGFTGSSPALIRYRRKLRGVPPVRARRRVETPPGVQAQHDWLTEHVEIAGAVVPVYGLLGTRSHSRASFVGVSPPMTPLAWQTGHLALFQRYGGVPRWIRIDHLTTGVSTGAGPTAVIHPAFPTFARAGAFAVDPCRAATGSDTGKVERRGRVLHRAGAPLFRQRWSRVELLQPALDARTAALHQRLRCPATGTVVAEAPLAERAVLRARPLIGEPFDGVVALRVRRDCLVSFEGRRDSVPLAYVGRAVEVLGTARAVVIRADGQELARHPRHTPMRLVLEPAHFEGPQTNPVIPPTPLGARARAQLAAHELADLPRPSAVARPLAAYVAVMEEACR